MTGSGGQAVPPLRERSLCVRVTAFAALVSSPEGETAFGCVASDDFLPKTLRRRLSGFDLGVARCIGGIAQHGLDEEIVFASRHGNMQLTTDLLVQLARDEVLSPAKFSMAVHNASIGVTSQIIANRAGHTSVAAGERSLAAGLTEAWLRLESGSPSVILCYSDAPLVGVYAEFDESGACVHLAMRLEPGSGEEMILDDGRAGAEALARSLGRGAGTVSWRL